jgi:ERCC4-related helicase
VLIIDTIVSNYPDENHASYVEHPLLCNKSIEFRLYQKKIAEASRGKNTLVILPTALGKTIISLLVSADVLLDYSDRRILIMAPTRPLVSQHMSSFVSTLKILEEHMGVITGKTPPEARLALWNKKEMRLLFATPEVVRNDLNEGRLSLKDFALLVFDEAHRAVKDYAYTSIAKEYVKCSSYPLILAMTASPGSEIGRMREICENLFIEYIEYRNEEHIDVKPYVNPINVKWEWFDLPEEYLYVISILRSMLDEKLCWLMQKGIIRRKSIEWIFKRDLINAGESLRYSLELMMEEQRGPIYLALMNQSIALTLMYCIELIGSQGSFSLKAFLDRIENDEGKAHTTFLRDSRIIEIKVLLENTSKEHPKIVRLIEIVKEHCHSLHTPNVIRNNSKILVFTQYRDTARHIAEVLSSSGFRSSRFVGQAKRQGDQGMKQEEQAAILESFRNGDFDILVATSIAEEGLDIPEVNLVIFYEPIPSEIRYIQRKGRTGRKSAGLVLILASNNTVDTRYHYASQKRLEKMKKSVDVVKASLAPIARFQCPANPMSEEELSIIEERERRLAKQLRKDIESDITKRVFIGGKIENSINKLREIKRKSSLLSETGLASTEFRRRVQRTIRKIHTQLTKAGRRGLDIKKLSDTLTVEQPVIIEALKQLEKLRRIVWLDESTVIITDNLTQASGKIYDIYVDKVLQGKALVIVNERWHVRLNHYDYEGPRSLLKSGAEFKAVGELYHENGVLSIRVRQIV